MLFLVSDVFLGFGCLLPIDLGLGKERNVAGQPQGQGELELELEGWWEEDEFFSFASVLSFNLQASHTRKIVY